MLNSERQSVVVMGVDPGTIVAGVAVVEHNGLRVRPLEFEAVKAPRRMGRSERIFTIFRRLMELASHFRPKYVVVERAYVHKNVQSALAIEAARTAAIIAAFQVGAQVSEYGAAEARKAVMGKGNATKQEVRNAIIRILGTESNFWKNLPLDVSDAAALAIAKATENPNFPRALRAPKKRRYFTKAEVRKLLGREP